MSNVNINSMYDRVKQKTGVMAVANIQSFEPVGNNAVRVVATLTKEPKTNEEAHAALAKVLGEGLMPLNHSFRTIEVSPHSGRITVAGFITAQAKAVVLSEENAGAYREMSSNILMDNTDESLWNVQTTASGQRIITRQLDDNLSELVSLATVSRADKKIPTATELSHNANILPTVCADNAEYMAFVNPETASVDYGYKVKTEANVHAIYSTETFSVIPNVTDAHVIHTVEMAGNDVNQEIAKPEGHIEDPQAAVDYFRELSNANPEFYVALEQDMDSLSII